jgi:hypothetical protein
VAFVDREEPFDARQAALALDRSRESLLAARESIDAALLEVDRALLAFATSRQPPAETASTAVPARDPLALATAQAVDFIEAFGAEIVRWLPRVLAAVKGPDGAPGHTAAELPTPGPVAPVEAARADPGGAAADSAALADAPAPRPEPADPSAGATPAPAPAVAREQGTGETPREEAPAPGEALLLPDLIEAVRRLGIVTPESGDSPGTAKR